jgi:hypothetical protein
MSKKDHFVVLNVALIVTVLTCLICSLFIYFLFDFDKKPIKPNNVEFYLQSIEDYSVPDEVFENGYKTLDEYYVRLEREYAKQYTVSNGTYVAYNNKINEVPKW